MPSPALLPIALVGAAGILYLLLRPSEKNELPADLKSIYEQMLATPDAQSDPDELDKVAAKLEALGYSNLAKEVRAKAARARAAQASPTAPTQPRPQVEDPSLLGQTSPQQPQQPRVQVEDPSLLQPAAGLGLPDISNLFVYAPDLEPVGSGDDYFPRSVTIDAAALSFLGFPTSDPGGGVSNDEDRRAGTGGFSLPFRSSVVAYQTKVIARGHGEGIEPDGFIGPKTRAELALDVLDAGGAIQDVLTGNLTFLDKATQNLTTFDFANDELVTTRPDGSVADRQNLTAARARVSGTRATGGVGEARTTNRETPRSARRRQALETLSVGGWSDSAPRWNTGCI